MRTIGTILKNTRTAKALNLDQIEKATKIKVSVLAKIEKDEIGNFDSFGHLSGLVKNYGEFLGIDSGYLTAILRRQTETPAAKYKKTLLLPKFSTLPTSNFLALFLLVLVFVYFIFQLLNLRAGPVLEVVEPAQGIVVDLPKIQVKGVTEPEAQVTVNGQKVPTNLSGEFSAEFELSQGVNLIEVVAKKGTGMERKIVRTVELSE